MDNQKFKDLLETNYQWPDYYDFKFIIKTEDKHLILEKLQNCQVHETPSKQGSYTSISVRKLIHHTEEIIEMYEMMSKIKGVISL